MEQEAIVVKNAMKRYRLGTQVLNDLNMTVSKGTIYGLLGPSGCGKTTLLSCIVGILRIDKGKIWVLGGSPGTKGSGIPGPRVGYMPQETSLVGEFTRSDALYYFGRINGLESDEIETRQKFLAELLQLPPENHSVKDMSGGQQRRVSFAAALIHKPELLILDEPTVGLDTILRESIWTYLIKITQDEEITVVITTHYIEEAKDANRVGLMRSGKLLAESSPQQLLERFQCISLEEAFLTLSRMQEDNTEITNISDLEASGSRDARDDVSYEDKDKHDTIECKENSKHKVSQMKIFNALMVKNGTQFLHNPVGLILTTLIPILQVCAFFIGIGLEPKGLTIGVINDEANCNHGNNLGNITYDAEKFTCHFENLSCRFLRDFGNSIIMQDYDNISEAITAVRNGKLVGITHFNQNFSVALQKRIENFKSVEEVDILAGEIQIFLDMGDRQIGLHTQRKLYERFFEIYANIMRDCKISPKIASIPVRFENPIYGTTNINFAEFMAPAYILSLIFFLTTTISAALIITDREEGVWKRSLVQGVTTTKIMLSHVLTEIIIVIVHTTITLCFCFYIWGLEYKGSIFILIWLSFLSGICGLMYGFLISVLSPNHTMANYCSTGSFVPVIVLSGCIWPVEAMPKVLRWMSMALPLTIPSISFRAVMVKGYSIQEPEVYNGFLVISSWILLFLAMCLVTIKLKSS